jgi:ribosome-binding factor A
MAGPSPRIQRVSALIRETLAELLRFEVKDPRVAVVTLTEVEVTGDLREARVYYTAPDDDRARAAAAEGLRRASGFLRRELGHRVRLRVTPTLDFRLDTSYEYGANIDRKLSELGLGPKPEDASDDDEDDADPDEP